MLKETYQQLESEREGFLEQARDHSELTIPSLIPPDGTTNTYADLYRPFQSIGSFGVNSLANKLAGALYPATEPFFKLSANTSAEEMEQLDQATLDIIDSKLSSLEQRILESITKRGDRGDITEALKHLIVGGNAVLYVGEESTQLYPLSDYVVTRDGAGNLLKVIVKDCLSYETFKEMHPTRTAIHAKHRGARSYDPKTIEVYTCMYRKDGMWYVHEEAAGVKIADTESKHPLDEPPYLVLRFNKIAKQAYGRAYIENLFGDLRSLENLSKAMVEASAINARCVFLANPSGATSMRRFEEADNGDVIPGVASDITTARVDKGADLAVTSNEIQRLEARLSTAFMLNNNQRDAERVTATEIRQVAQEIEAILGGAYAVLSEEFQRPYITRLMRVLRKSGDIPDLPEGLLETSIVTGTAGIGRGIDRQRMVEFIQTVGQAVGPEVLAQQMNINVALARLAASFGINLQGLIKSQEQQALEAQQRQEAMMTEKLGPNAVAAMGQVATEQVRQGGSNGDQANQEDNQA